MVNRCLPMMFFVLCSANATASGDKYEICRISGYFCGQKSAFLCGIAESYLYPKDIFGSPECSDMTYAAYQLGRKQMSSEDLEKLSSDSKATLIAAKSFERKVYEFMKSKLNLYYIEDSLFSPN